MLSQLRRITFPLIAVLYAAWNFIAWIVNDPQEFGDTYRYFGSTLFDIQNPGFTPVLLYTTAKSPELVTFLQVAIYVACWLLLAYVILARTAWKRSGLVLAVLTLVVSMTTPLWSWNMFLASESLAISFSALWLASIIWLVQRRTTWSLFLSVIAGSNLIIDRPQLTPLVVVVVAISAVWFYRMRRQLSVAGLGFLAILPAAFWGIARLTLLSSDAKYRYRYAIDNLMDKTPSFRPHALENIGQCEPITTAINGPAPWDDMWKLKENLASVCPDAFLWLQSSKTGLTTWVMQMPATAIQNFFDVAITWHYFPYSAARAMPDALSTLLMPNWTTWLISLVYLAIGLVFLLVSGSRLRVSVFGVISTVLLILTAAVTAFAIWGADGIEHERHLIPLTILIPIAALVLPATLSAGNSRLQPAQMQTT
ncbi:MAG: hypothetical protein PHN51_06715 [Candidatus Nanopelagicales bacterium]|nr:hypothetical protein [Candidatus Nanopelagicales bacterium]